MSYERADLGLVLRYNPKALGRVREMVRREEECCAFLAFEITEDVDAVSARITAPEAARRCSRNSKLDTPTPRHAAANDGPAGGDGQTPERRDS